jgi:hypothetical protein
VNLRIQVLFRASPAIICILDAENDSVNLFASGRSDAEMVIWPLAFVCV